MMKDNDISLINKILPGLGALVILLILSGPKLFYPWLIETLVVYTAWFFLLSIIIQTIMNRKYDRKSTPTLIIGALALILTFIAFGNTPYGVVIDLLQATAIWSVVYTSFGWIKVTIHRRG